MLAVAVNLRLRPDAEAALRAESERTGLSQQALLREAVDRFLGLTAVEPVAPRSPGESLVASGTGLPARSPYREPTQLVPLPDGTTSSDLLDRDDRV
jgi:hypothetical protein